MARLVPLLLVELVLLACRPAAQPTPPVPPAGEGKGAPAVVVKVVDGDTIDVNLLGGRRERVRLIGINAPESKKPNSPIECYGPEASVHLAELLTIGTDVFLLRDAEARDTYGRFLGYVVRADDDLFVNLRLAQTGDADQLPIEPNTTFADDIAAAVAQARTNRVGLWAACPDHRPAPRHK